MVEEDGQGYLQEWWWLESQLAGGIEPRRRDFPPQFNGRGDAIPPMDAIMGWAHDLRDIEPHAVEALSGARDGNPPLLRLVLYLGDDLRRPEGFAAPPAGSKGGASVFYVFVPLPEPELPLINQL